MEGMEEQVKATYDVKHGGAQRLLEGMEDVTYGV